MEHLVQEQILPIPLATAWEFFSDVKNLDKITPAEMGFSTISAPEGPVYPGALIIHRLQLAPFIAMKWVTEIKVVDYQKSFIDEQRFGPYRFWHHRHSFEEVPEGTLIRDEVYWKVPFEPFSWPVKALFVKPKTQGIFEHRREILADYFSKTETP